MDKIGVDFVFEFAKDLKRLIEQIEQDYNRFIFLRKDEIIKKITKNASNLTENLFEKYKNTLDLQFQKDLGKFNLKFKNSSNEIVFIPEDLLKSFSFNETKEELEILLILMNNNNFSLDYFIFRFSQLFSHSNQKIKTINVNTFEKIRFFMNFVNIFPDYITETELPNEAKNKNYKSLYSSWGRTKTYSGVDL